MLGECQGRNYESNMKLQSIYLSILLLSLASAASAQQVTFREELVTENRPIRQHVIVPVREYRVQSRLTNTWEPIHGPSWVLTPTPYLRWEERLQTTYQPVVRRAYRPVIETSTTPPRPVILAERPRRAESPRAVRAYDNLPLVAVQPPTNRTAQAPRTTLTPKELKPSR
jgi:hypothetical protein